MDNQQISEIVYKRFVWTRTNTIELFELAQQAKILQYKPKYLIENPTENHNLLYQFQCVLTSTNAHFRRIRNEENIRFGIYIENGTITKKQEIPEKNILIFLKSQIEEAQQITSNITDIQKLISSFITIGEHEALHQGQIVVMFREKKVEFPAEFKQAWNL